MRQLPFVLALLAFGAAAFAFLVARDAAHAVRDRGEADAAVEQRLAALELALRARDAERPGALPPTGLAGASGAPAGGPAAGGPAPAGGPELAGGARPVSPADLERRLADLEKRVPSVTAGTSVESAVAFEGPGATTWVGTVADAAKAFELTPAQRDDMERVLADARRDVDALRKTPDETGVTWETVEKDVVKMENGALHFDGSKLSAFREKVIPGRGESFGSAMRRIRDDAAQRLKATLSPAQREKWDKSQTGGLLPGSDNAGFGIFSFGSVTTTTVDAPEAPDASGAMDGK